MKRTTTVRLDLAQLHLLDALLEAQQDSGEYWGNREHFLRRLERTIATIDAALAELED